jgi:hypothetical protein
VGRPDTIINLMGRDWASLGAHGAAQHDPLANSGRPDTIINLTGRDWASLGAHGPAQHDPLANPSRASTARPFAHLYPQVVTKRD